MSRASRAIVIAYHGIEPGPPPLFVDPDLFRMHLDLLVESGVEPVSLERLVSGLRDGDLPERCAAITFDDGFASVPATAAPLLAERAIPATVFCVAGWLGRTNDWPSQPAGVPRRPLADARALAELPAAGIAIGSHGIDHVPLPGGTPDGVLTRELAGSRSALEDAVGSSVRWFAHPYGAPASMRARELIEATYDGACGGGNRPVRPGADLYALPRVEAHYLRRPALYRRALTGLDSYLGLRRTGARARRLVRSDWRE